MRPCRQTHIRSQRPYCDVRGIRCKGHPYNFLDSPGGRKSVGNLENNDTFRYGKMFCQEALKDMAYWRESLPNGGWKTLIPWLRDDQYDMLCATRESEPAYFDL